MPTFNITLKEDFETAIKLVTEALKQNKFGILNEIHVDTVLKNKLDIIMPRYRILSACNAPLAHRLISQHADIGALFPCNVLVREETDGTTSVIFMDPVKVFGLTNNPDVIEIAEEARTEMMRVRDALAS
jgi:uncharacterized protein (DUF302 family)